MKFLLLFLKELKEFIFKILIQLKYLKYQTEFFLLLAKEFFIVIIIPKRITKYVSVDKIHLMEFIPEPNETNVSEIEFDLR